MSKNISTFLKYFPQFKGKIRLGKLIHKSTIAKNKEISFNLSNPKLTITVPNLIENVSFELFINGNYEKDIIDYFIKNIPQNGVFFDIGANIGAFSFTLAKLRPDIKIFAFEAAPFVFNYLKKNIEQNNITNVICINKAVHLDDSITLPFYSSKEKNGKGSFSSVFTNEAVMVETVNLDKFIFENNISPNIIKIDVEGYEKLIFQSMKHFLTNSKNVEILFEFVDWAEDQAHNHKAGDAQIEIKNYGYNLFEVVNNKLIPKNEIQYKGVCKNLIAKK